MRKGDFIAGRVKPEMWWVIWAYTRFWALGSSWPFRQQVIVSCLTLLPVFTTALPSLAVHCF